MSSVEEFKRLNTRRASVLQVGGFRPTGDAAASNFGSAALSLPGEAWPEANGRPLLFVCQMNLTTAPVVPVLLQDIKLITFFARAADDCEDWQLRAYKSLDGLVPSAPPVGVPVFKRGFECRWEECEDHPNPDDPDFIIPEGFDESEVDLENVARTKIGGYASSIQSEPWWGYQEHPSNPAYCFQINSEENVGLVWGDGGTVYIARGTVAGCEDEWFLDWQSF